MAMEIKEGAFMRDTFGNADRLPTAALSAVTQAKEVAGDRSQKLMAAGGILGSIAAMSCCILPLVLFSLGISGAWIGNLTSLAPYQPYFIAATLAFLGCGYWLVYRSRRVVCTDGVCARPLPNRLVIFGLVLATIFVAADLAFNFLAPVMLS
ncbi:MAG: mercuric transporter MerT family protein [Hyphomicrobiales bacterium]